MHDHETIRRSRRGTRRGLQLLLAPFALDWGELDAIDGTGRLWGIELLTLLPLAPVFR